eukprot:TRINITY_DN691_c0_g2_i1.p1 TRINITY_DN691_c0_g2~~TRINITY_DN691_c0_g2_i1.p1  ORF type:complete len:164 (+),score=82.01 TRINITY_DN691_c0_g2_i1:51-542(+)
MSLRTILKPVNVLFGAAAGIGNTADARVVKYHNSDFGAHLKRAAETGEDLGSSFYGKWVVHSIVTIPDRFTTLVKELGQLPAGCMVMNWSLNDWLLLAHYVLKAMFVFLLFKMVGRGQIAPLVGTDSIFFNSGDKIDTDCARAKQIECATEWAAGFKNLITLC